MPSTLLRHVYPGPHRAPSRSGYSGAYLLLNFLFRTDPDFSFRQSQFKPSLVVHDCCYTTLCVTARAPWLTHWFFGKLYSTATGY